MKAVPPSVGDLPHRPTTRGPAVKTPASHLWHTGHVERVGAHRPLRTVQPVLTLPFGPTVTRFLSPQGEDSIPRRY